MPPRADAPLRRITLNLYTSDCDFLSAYLGHGWTEQVRTLVHAYAQGLQPQKSMCVQTIDEHGEPKLIRRTLGDLQQ